MAPSLHAFVFFAFALSITAPAQARDDFERGSTAYIVGFYNSAARQLLSLAKSGNRPHITILLGFSIRAKASAETVSRPRNGFSSRPATASATATTP